MAPRTSERGRVIPVRDLARETAASANGPVVTYKLSPEELERYRAQTKSKGAVNVAKPQLDGPKNGPTKQVFVEQIANGETIGSIEKAYGMKYQTLTYWVGKWNLRGITQEKARELLGNQEVAVSTEAYPPMPTGTERLTPAEIERVDSEIHQMEIERLNSELRKARIDYDSLKEKLEEEWMASAEALQLLNETKRRLNDLEQTVTYRTEPSTDGYLTIRIPIIADTGDRFVMMSKVHEELEEVGAEIETQNIDRRKAASELYDLVQSFAGLIRAELSDLVVNGSVDQLLQDFFDHHNQEHITKIRTYAAERGWKLHGTETES